MNLSEGKGGKQLLRPYGVLIDGKVELGLEVLVAGGVIQEVRPHTGMPEPYFLSPGFVNAHSHLEYRGLQDKVMGTEYWSWIRELTGLKAEQSPDQVREDAHLAARENVAAGVRLIGEHSDRSVSGEALQAVGLQGRIFQETITFFEWQDPSAKLAQVEENRRLNERFFSPVTLSPHSGYTVDPETLRAFGRAEHPISIHVCETELENQFMERGEGEIAEFYRRFGVPFSVQGMRMIPYLDTLGILRPGAQLVHCCAVNEEEIALIAKRGASVAHCPRSNRRLGCPVARVREMLEAGISVGLGLDSAASGGQIDMFAEMRAALDLSRGALSADEVWRMATEGGAATLGVPNWKIEKGSQAPLIRIEADWVRTTEDLLAHSQPRIH